MIVDYLTFTFEKEFECNLDALGRNVDAGAVVLESTNGYGRRLSLWGSGSLVWDHVGDMVARLSLPGKALALYRESGGDVHSLISLVTDAGGRCTRIDFAFDWEIEARPVIDRVEEAIRGGNYTSRWRLENSRSCNRMRSVLAPGDTLYLGSPQSDCRLRIYDKAAEQQEEGPRLRIELQVRKERAHAVACEIAVGNDDTVGYVKGLILGYFDIKEPVEGDSNKSRWPSAAWWSEMWGSVKHRVTLGGDLPSEETSRAWIERLGASMAILVEIADGDVGFLFDAIKGGMVSFEQGGRRRPIHEAKLKAWKRARDILASCERGGAVPGGEARRVAGPARASGSGHNIGMGGA